MKETLELLLRRGANPNTSDVPMPVLFLAIKAADVDMVRTLLLHGASTQISLPEDVSCLLIVLLPTIFFPYSLDMLLMIIMFCCIHRIRFLSTKKFTLRFLFIENSTLPMA